MKRTAQLQLMRDKLKESRETGEPVWVTLGNERMKIKAVDPEDLPEGYNNIPGEYIVHANGRVHWPVDLITKDAHPNPRALSRNLALSRHIKLKNIMAVILERHKREAA